MGSELVLLSRTLGCGPVPNPSTANRIGDTLMSRIIVVPDSVHLQLGCPPLMDEQVRPEHLQDGHLDDQLIERVAWAICASNDAERQSLPFQAGRVVRDHQ